MGEKNNGEGRMNKGAMIGRKHVEDTLRRQGREENDEAHLIGLTHCQGATPRGSPEELQMMS